MYEKVNPAHPDKIADWIHAFLEAQRTGRPVELSCAIGDTDVGGIPYADIVKEAGEYIRSVGGFERFAEWGLV